MVLLVIGSHPKVLALRFQHALSHQQRINWRVRYIEGDLTPTETRALQACLTVPLDPLTDQAAWLARLDEVSHACREHQITLVHTPHRYFHH